MARTRSIKPQFFHDVEILELPPLARLLYIGLWCYADRKGRLEDKPKQIKQDVLPSDQCDIEQLLTLLASGSEPFIIRYCAKGKKVIQIIQFSKHQNPHPHEADSNLPPLEEAEEQEQAATCNDMARQATTATVDDIACRAGSCSLVSGSCSLVSGDNSTPDGDSLPLFPQSPYVTVDSNTSETQAVHSRNGLRVIEVSEFESWFEREFWPLYPKKKAKVAAKKAAKYKMTTREMRDKALDGLRRQLPAVDNPIYFPNGSTWFNNDQWEDEVYTATRPQSKTEREEAAFAERMAYEAELRSRMNQQEPKRIAQ